MKRAGSLQRRLGLGFAAGITTIWLLASLAAGAIIRHELDEHFDSALQQTAQRLLPLAITDVLDREGALTARRVDALDEHKELLTYLVRDRAGNVLLQSHDAKLELFPQRPMLGFRDTPTHRLYGEATIQGSVIIEVADPLAHRVSAAREAHAALLLPLLFMVPVSLLAAWWFVRRSMRPVLVLESQIARRGAGDLSPVQDTGLPAELGPIAQAVNGLIERLRLTLAPGAAVHSYLDPDAFAILMRNLIENALRHGAADGALDVLVSSDGAIHVLNEGDVVPPATLRRLTARFERGTASVSGAGLGLAIAEVIATGAGGTLELRSPATGRADGFEAVVRVS